MTSNYKKSQKQPPVKRTNRSDKPSQNIDDLELDIPIEPLPNEEKDTPKNNKIYGKQWARAHPQQ